MLNKNGLGSRVEVDFFNEVDLSAASRAVASLGQRDLRGKSVWLDAQQTRKARRPMKFLHQMARILTDFEHAKGRPFMFEAHTDGYSVTSQDLGIIGSFSHGSFQWSDLAVSRFSPVQRLTFIAFARGGMQLDAAMRDLALGIRQNINYEDLGN